MSSETSDENGQAGAERSEAHVEHFALGEHEYAVIELPPDRAEELFAELSNAESDVARLLASGKTNREIAERRRTAERTVVNQVSAIFRKLEVGSRAEFVRLIHGGDDSEDG